MIRALSQSRTTSSYDSNNNNNNKSRRRMITKMMVVTKSSSSDCSQTLKLNRNTVKDKLGEEKYDDESFFFLSSTRALKYQQQKLYKINNNNKTSNGENNRNKRRTKRLTIRAESETRIASVLTSLPQRFDLYFQRRSYRMFLWKTISVFIGFYLANVITLSFGALGINDVVAGALLVFLYELVTRWYYKTNKPGRKLEFLNCFKLGLTFGLIADAFKLGS